MGTRMGHGFGKDLTNRLESLIGGSTNFAAPEQTLSAVILVHTGELVRESTTAAWDVVAGEMLAVTAFEVGALVI